MPSWRATWYCSHNKTMNTTRDKKGRFAKSFKRLAFLLFLLAIAGGAWYFSSGFNTEVKYVDVTTTKTIVINTTQQIIDKEKNDILDALENCESKSNPNAIAWEDFGTGKNRASFGAYMLKVGTIESYLSNITDFQAIALASDTGEARKLSEDIIFNHDGGIYNWKNCMIKNNLLERVNFVKQLESKNTIINK